jgi:hypothetical protein
MDEAKVLADILEAASENTEATKGISYTAQAGSVFARNAAWVNEVTGQEQKPKPKRGRPRVMSELFQGYAHFHYGHVKTDRGRQNLRYAYNAIDVLDIQPEGSRLAEFGWLINWAHADKDRKGAIKWGILTEIGRIAEQLGDDHAIEAARYVCNQQDTVKASIAELRNWRLKSLSGRDDYDEWRASKAKDKCAGLTRYKRLARVIAQYCAEHPETADDDVLATVRVLHDNLEG